MYKCLFIIFISISVTSSQPTKCDQTPPHATVPTPAENKGVFFLTIANDNQNEGKILYTPDQTYVCMYHNLYTSNFMSQLSGNSIEPLIRLDLQHNIKYNAYLENGSNDFVTLSTADPKRPFRWFMITAEDPEVDNYIYDYQSNMADVGTLKILDSRQSRYSERCVSSVENFDNADKSKVEIHWVSPKDRNTEKVRIRAMVAENNEAWYIGDNLTLIIEKDIRPSSDTPPLKPKEVCRLCSEARYELIFNGRWSRMAHPRHYPSKPDENGYSHMVGASHDYNFTLWGQGIRATPGLQKLAEEGNSTVMEREIIDAMARTPNGTRTLIRGKSHYHPDMFAPSYSLFRVDNTYHLFSIAVGLRPSPDWFLGTSKFELCDDDEWLEYYEIPLYPWDAGTMDGVSYESQKSMTQPVDNIERVEVGSFNAESPFYQMNLNDLKPFAMLEIRRLDVYPWDEADCPDANTEEESAGDEPHEEPLIGELKQTLESCNSRVGEWGEWSPCIPDVGSCGIGAQSRRRERIFNMVDNPIQGSKDASCNQDSTQDGTEIKHCYVEC